MVVLCTSPWLILLKETDMSKGSTARPYSVPREEFENKWEAIFGRREQQEPEPQPQQDDPIDDAK